MIYLNFRIASDRYAIALSQIHNVVPSVALKKIPESPPWLPGLLQYQQQAVPVIDMCQIACGVDASNALGTRIALLPYIQDEQCSEACSTGLHR